MALSDLLNTLRGFGEGATAGTIKYPQALLLAKTMGIPYEQALAQINQERRDLSSSAAYQAGNIGGGLAQGLVSGGATLPAALARNVGIGALGGFAANEGMDNALKDTLMGAGLGGATGLVGGLMPKVTQAAKTHLSKNPEVQAIAAKQLEDQAATRFAKLLDDPIAAKAYQDVLAGKLPEGVTKALKPTKVSERLDSPEKQAAYTVARLAVTKSNPLGLSETAAKAGRDVLYGTMPSATVMAKKIDEGVWTAKGKVLLSDLMQDAAALAPTVIGGGVAGYGLGSSGVLGEKVDPLQAALGFAMAGGGLGAARQTGDLKLKAWKTAPALLPKTAGPRTAAAATALAAPAVVRAQAQAENRPELDPFAKYREAGEEDEFEKYREK